MTLCRSTDDSVGDAPGDLTVTPDPGTGRAGLSGLWLRFKARCSWAGFARGTFNLVREIALVGALFALYKLGRYMGRGDVSDAFANAHHVLSFERTTRLATEADLQQMALNSVIFIKALNRYYVSVHFPATLVFLVWLYFRHRGGYKHIRFVIASSTFVALCIHMLFPLAPPRMMPGFVDTNALYGPDPYNSAAVRGTANQFAAMPSVHFMWAALLAYGVIRYSRSRIRWVILAHPVITLMAIILTGNHYWVDAIAGGLLFVGALAVTPKRLTEPRPQSRPSFAPPGLPIPAMAMASPSTAEQRSAHRSTSSRSASP